jgi:RNA polymerase sigma factor (sigma-70 family)
MKILTFQQSSKNISVCDVTIFNFTGNQYRETRNRTVPEVADEIIMQNVKDGNLSEMSVLFERYHLKLFNFFLKLTRDKYISQDLTQNLFYRMMKYKNSYKYELSVKSWMYQMARNLHRDYCKEEKRSEELFMQTGSYPVDVTDDSSGFQEEEYEKLEHAFSSLSNEQKELIVLSRYQKLKYEEISEIICQSVPAIKVAMYRAIKKLRGIYLKQI